MEGTKGLWNLYRRQRSHLKPHCFSLQSIVIWKEWSLNYVENFKYINIPEYIDRYRGIYKHRETDQCSLWNTWVCQGTNSSWWALIVKWEKLKSFSAPSV